MEPFIQLTYSEQCPQKTSQLTETSFIDKRKVPENFWLDLLERKCPKGLGEVSESLVNDDNLSAVDFLDDQNVSPDVGNSEQFACSNDCLTNPKTVDCNEFKTPLTSRYKHKISETPCLFSQDESVNHTPTSSLKSQPTCHGDATYKPVDTNPSTPEVVGTPVVHSRYTVGRHWSRGRTTTPDILAEIMGQRTSNLSCLLAGGSDDDVTEWSESMATPPLKIKESAGDETDGEKGHLEEIDENVVEEEAGQPPSKRIARNLFARSNTNQSMEPVELSVDDVNTVDQPLEPLEGKDAMLDTAQTAENSCIVEEFLLEYSCHDDSKCDDNNLSKTLLEDSLRPPPPLNKPSRSEADLDDNVTCPSSPVYASRVQFSPSSPKPILTQSPYPNNFFSPTTQTQFQVLAQSTPKPVSSDTSITCSTGFNIGLNDYSVPRDYDTSLSRDATVLSGSRSPLRDKAQVQATCGVTCHTTEVNGKLEVSDVTFGSPSRSFELAMAREADKLCSGIERDSRTSGLGSSLSVSLNAQSPHTDDILNKTTNFQLTESLQQVIKTPRNKMNVENENTYENSGEPTTRSADDHGSLVRRKSFCKVPGLRRSVRTKRFSYPTASQVAKQDGGKRVRKTATTVDALRVVEKENSTPEEGKVVIDRSAKFADRSVCDTNKNKGGDGEMPVAKRLKSDETGTFFESERDAGSLSSAANHIEKDDVLFDMDALSQFPVECICSPPPLNRVSNSLNGYTTASTARQGREGLILEGTGNASTDSVLQEIDKSTVCEADGAGVHSVERTVQNEDERKESDTIRNPVSCVNLQKNALPLLSESNTGFHTAGEQKIEISDKALSSALALFEEFDLPTTSLTSHERGTTADEVVGADSVREGRNLTKGTKLEMAVSQENHGGVSKAKGSHQLERYSPDIEGKVEEVCTDMFDYSNVKPYIANNVAPEFAGFHTASGKHVSISSEALTKAKATMKEIDNSLRLHEWPNGQPEEPSDGSNTCDIGKLASTSCKPTPDSDIVRVSSCAEGGIVEQSADHKHFAKRENISGLEKQQSSVVSGFCGFSTASGNQVYVSESAMKQARKTLSEIDAELNVGSSSSQSLEVTGVKGEPSYSIRNEHRASENGQGSAPLDGSSDDTTENPRVSGKELENALLDGPAYGTRKNLRTSQFKVTPQSDQLSNDVSGTSTSLRKSEFEEVALQNSKQAVDELESQQRENINDSLLEDLLNDCKRKRRDSLAVICEENEGITASMDEDSDLKRWRSNDNESSEHHENIATECCLSSTVTTSKIPSVLFQTASGKAVSVSQADLNKARDTWNKIDQELVLAGADRLQRKELKSGNGFQTVPVRAVDNLQSSLSTSNAARSITNKADEGIENDGQCRRVSGFSTFSGFQTARGTKVTLSEEALRRGRDIMKRIAADSSEHCLDKRGETSSSFTVCNHSTSRKNDHASKYAVKGRDLEGNEVEEGKDYHWGIQTRRGKKEETDKGSKSTAFLGFQTAAGKRLEVSEDALQRGAQIMQQIDNSLEQGINEGRHNTDHFTAVPRVNLSNESSVPHLRSTSGFSGFQTASGQSVKLSKESLQKGEAIMQQIDRSLEQNKDTTVSNPCNTTGFSGFQTASGQSVKLSKESFEKGAAIMQQIDKSLEQNKDTSVSHSRSISGFSGFQTASGQSVKLSKESLEEGAAIMQQIDKSLEQNRDTSGSNSRSTSGFTGFQTASGQSVNLSKESLQKGAAIMQQIDKSLEQNKDTSGSHSRSTSGFTGFQTASGQSVKLSKETLEKGAAIMQQIDKSLEQNKDTSGSHSRSTSGFTGFQTASGQSVKLSKETLEKGAAIMQQIDKSLKQNRDASGSHSRSTAGFTGFQTASGQSVKLSKESLQKGAAIIQQIDKSLQENRDNSVSHSGSSTGFSGFQTASGQSVKLSKKSMEKGAAIMEQIDKSLQENRDNIASETSVSRSEPSSTSSSSFSGFQTAGGKTVKISESALAKAKKTMVGIERELQTVNVDSTTISHDATRKAGEQMNLIAQETGHSTTVITNGNHGDKFKGFFTAGGQSVSVSEEALNKAKAFLLDTDRTFNESKTEETASSIVPTEAHGRTMSTPSRSCSVEHDEAVSREVLESSEALLAYESIMDASGNCHDRTAVGWSSFNTSEGSFILGRDKGLACASNHNFPRRCLTPLRCSEDMFNPNHSETRDGMKPCSTTPSGVLHDRRARFHPPLRARLTTVESSCSPRGSDGNRSLRPLRATTPGCFRSKSAPSPRTSTPLNSTANRRMSGPRPQFITPYRKQEAAREVSPLARCSSSSLPVSGSSEVRDDVVEPSSKKPRISTSNSTLNVKSGHRETASKTDCKCKPQPGFLSQLRHQNQRIKLKDYVGHGTLPGQYTTAELIELGVSPEVISVTSSNAESFRFVGRKYFSESVLSSEAGVRTEDGGVLHAGTNGCVGLEEIQSAFLSTPGVDSQLVSNHWIANHYRWLVWKLAAMEVAFPRQFAGRCLNPDWVLCQLKYRYDREIDNSNRSALKKIMERDDISSRTMVLCVSSVTVTANQAESAGVEQQDNVGEKDGQGTVNNMESCAIIEVTDGWYGIRAMLDRPLTRLLHDGQIVEGQKLFVYGAELIGSEQAVSPLEAPSSLMLRLHANSTRRARWDVKLGFHSHTHAFPLPLASLFGDGGFTGCVDVIVLRQYPVQWMEKMADGTNIFRNSRLEEREAKRFEADRHQRREKLFLKIQDEFEKECQQPEKRRSARFRRRSFSSRDLNDLHDGKEIYEALTQASDPDAVKECLSERQIRALDDYRRLLQERKFAELQSKFERVWKEREEEQQQLQRNVVPLLKVRIDDYLCKGQAKQNAVLSIWRPSEEVMHLLSEGSRLRIYHLTTAGVRNRQGVSELQLSATRTTRYEELPSDPDVKRMVYVPRQACSFDELRCSSFQSCSEVDVVGLVVYCSPVSSFSSSSVQTVYLSDDECNLVAIKFWGGLKAVAVEDFVKPRSFICCSNLTVRSDDRLQYPSLTFSELSTLTLKPREPHLRTALNNLQQNIPDLNLFMCNIQQTLNTILRPNRASPSVDVKVNTVRMYGQSPDGAQSYDSTPRKQSLDVMDSLDSSGIENSSSINGLEHRSVGHAQSTPCSDHAVSHKSSVSSLEEPARLATPSASAHAKSRSSKRKLLDIIAEPPPLSALPSSIPASVRREFKRPRQVGRPGNVHLE